MKSRASILHAIGIIVLHECCGGCLILAVGYHERGDQFAGKCVDTGKVDAVKPKIATREQVARELGPPTVAFNDERLWVYTWVVQREFHVLWAVTSLESSAGGAWRPDGDRNIQERALDPSDDRDFMSRSVPVR